MSVIDPALLPRSRSGYACGMTKLSLVPRDDEAEALYWLDKTRRILSPDPVERDAALALLCKPQASIAVAATVGNDPA